MATVADSHLRTWFITNGFESYMEILTTELGVEEFNDFKLLRDETDANELICDMENIKKMDNSFKKKFKTSIMEIIYPTKQKIITQTIEINKTNKKPPSLTTSSSKSPPSLTTEKKPSKSKPQKVEINKKLSEKPSSSQKAKKFQPPSLSTQPKAKKSDKQKISRAKSYQIKKVKRPKSSRFGRSGSSSPGSPGSGSSTPGSPGHKRKSSTPRFRRPSTPRSGRVSTPKSSKMRTSASTNDLKKQTIKSEKRKSRGGSLEIKKHKKSSSSALNKSKKQSNEDDDKYDMNSLSSKISTFSSVKSVKSVKSQSRMIKRSSTSNELMNKRKKIKTTSTSASLLDAKKRKKAKEEKNKSRGGFTIHTNRRVRLDDGRIGIIRYKGRTAFGKSSEDWVGIVVEYGKGQHNGSVNGRAYFRCRDGKGIMVRPDRIIQDLGNPNTKVLDDNMIKGDEKIQKLLKQIKMQRKAERIKKKREAEAKAASQHNTNYSGDLEWKPAKFDNYKPDQSTKMYQQKLMHSKTLLDKNKDEKAGKKKRMDDI